MHKSGLNYYIHLFKGSGGVGRFFLLLLFPLVLIEEGIRALIKFAEENWFRGK